MNRREALRNVAILMGGVISVTSLSVIVQGCNPSKKKGQLFTAHQEKTIMELADTIIPTTNTPGAKAAGVGPFVAMMVEECYPVKIQKLFEAGLNDLDKRSETKFSGSFITISSKQRAVILQDVLTASKKGNKKQTTENGNEKKRSQASKKDVSFFQLAKELTMLGYFTSEVGSKQALAYLPVPGKYEGCVDLQPGQKAWAL